MLNTLNLYTDKWLFEVNVNKQRWLLIEMVVKSNVMKNVSIMMLKLIVFMYLLTLALILNSMVNLTVHRIQMYSI